MFTLRVEPGKNVYENISWINPATAKELGLSKESIIIDADFRISPIRLVFNDLVRENEISLPMHIMYKLGAYAGEERRFEVVEEIKEAKKADIYVIGNIHDWIDHLYSNQHIYVTLDDEIAISPKTSVRILDIEGAEVGEVYRLTHRTKMRVQFAGLMNVAVAIDASSAMLEHWRDRRKVDIAKELSKILLEYNLRKTQNCAIFSFADDVDILLNWISIDPKLRWFMTALIPRFVTDMIIKDTSERNLEGALEMIMHSLEERNLGRNALNTILIIQAKDSKLGSSKIKEFVNRIDEISGGVWRTIWVGLGNEKFENLSKVASAFGGVFISAKTPSGIIKKARRLSDFRHIDRMW